jgi:hypothetical protein
MFDVDMDVVQDLSGLSDQELEQWFGVLQGRMQALEAERLQWLWEIERRNHGFGIRMEWGRPVFTRPDGTRLEEGGPP